jgi:hypothetical protein
MDRYSIILKKKPIKSIKEMDKNEKRQTDLIHDYGPFGKHLFKKDGGFVHPDKRY